MRHNSRGGEYYLSEFLKIAPLSHALWRSCEALAFEKAKPQKPVLDLGCGFGEFAGVAFNKIEVGIDINKQDLKKAFPGRKYAKLLAVDARKMPFKDNSFKTVISVSVLEHIKGVDQVIEETSRILKKEGLFIFSVPTIHLYENLLITKIAKRLGMEVVSKLYFKAHCHFFKHVSLKSPRWWARQLKKNGFEIVLQQGTVSPQLLRLHEIFLLFALPSQLSKIFFGRRLVISKGLRSKLLPKLFTRFVYPEVKSNVNLFFIAQKK